MVAGYTCVALIPPTKVYIDTPTGSKNVAAMICIPVLVTSAMVKTIREGCLLQRRYGSRSPQQHVGTGENIVDKTQGHKDDMRNASCRSELVSGHTFARTMTVKPTISDSDHFQGGVRFGDFSFARNPQQSEEDDHWTAARCKPERSCNPIVIPYKAGTQHCRSPEPRLHQCQSKRIPNCTNGLSNIPTPLQRQSNQSVLCDWPS